LTEHESQALYRWGGSGANIRLAQRGEFDKIDRFKRAGIESELEAWNSAVDKAPEYDGTVYRGLTDVDEDVIDSWIESGEITLNNDQSATSNRGMGESFASSWSGGQVLWEIDQSSGKDLLGQTKATMGGKLISESEIIIRMGTTYEITGSEYTITRDGYEPVVFNQENFPDYWSGTEYSWNNFPPKDDFNIRKDYKGYTTIYLKEKP